MLLNISLSGFMNLLKTADKNLFIYINGKWTNDFFDWLLVLWREPNTWMPVYLFLLLFMLMNFKSKAWFWIIFFVITIVLCDQISSTYIKNYFNRLRPCGDPAMAQYCRLLLGRCPTSGSFTSSHATNHFGMAVFIACTLKDYLKKWVWFFYIWAATISYAQVYVGVHYPFDVVGGAVLGCLIGHLSASVYNRRFSLHASLPANGIN